MSRWPLQVRALELFGEKNRLGRGSNLGWQGGNLCLWGPERFFSVFRNAECTYPLSARAKNRIPAQIPAICQRFVCTARINRQDASAQTPLQPRRAAFRCFASHIPNPSGRPRTPTRLSRLCSDTPRATEQPAPLTRQPSCS